MAIYKMFRGHVIARGKLDVFIPETADSTNWKHWKANLDVKSCEACREQHGKVYRMDEMPVPEPPLHPNCRCTVEAMRAVMAGKASKEEENGADWWIRNRGILPPYYLTEAEFRLLGWDNGRSPAKYAQGLMMTRETYSNKNGHLPTEVGRVWYEADLNYYSGKRNGHRLLWSNDGLIFVTYDHYRTFMEVIGENRL